MVVCVRKIVLIATRAGFCSDFVVMLLVVAQVRTTGARLLVHAGTGGSAPDGLERQHQHQDDEQNTRHAGRVYLSVRRTVGLWES